MLCPIRMGELKDDLARPHAYTLPMPRAVELRETHASWVFLTEAEVFKVKKPVSFGFLDFSTAEKRRLACEAEVVLNTRLAAGVYLGVVPVRRSPDGRYHFHEGGDVVDWAVHMLRLSDDHRADVRLARGELGGAAIARIAEHLAAYHARSRRGADVAHHGTISTIERNVRESFAETESVIASLMTPAQAAELRSYQLGTLEKSAERFERRRLEGRIVDGHGDLRLEHIYLEDTPEAGDGITILDCIEFDERFRCADVCADLAFLSMDLIAHGRVDLAELLLARYSRAADDYELYGLVDFYESYRAFVRGKVAMLLAATVKEGFQRERLRAEARRHLLLALSFDRKSLLAPSVVAVGGVIASGKSTVADALGVRLSAPIIDADRTRKAMLGVAAERPLRTGAFAGPYDPAVTDAVYDEMIRRASIVLASGRPVIFDASFRTAELRRRARRLASEHGVPFLFTECRAPSEVCLERLDARERKRTVSDGRRAIFFDFLRRSEPVTELAASEHVVVDTTKPVADSMRVLETRLRFWPEDLVA